MSENQISDVPRLRTEQEGEVLYLHFAGEWRRGRPLPEPAGVAEELRASAGVDRLFCDGAELHGWDSLLLTFVLHVQSLCEKRGIAFETEGLPEGVRRLLALAGAVPQRRKHAEPPASRLVRFSHRAQGWLGSIHAALEFLGEAALSFGRLLTGRARFRRSDLLLHIQDSGARALPIVTLVSLLVGLILAFIGAVQLRMFGAEVYIADLVGLAMARDMGAMMTAIIMAGRTGAAYAAQLGTMQGTDEIDAYRTLGISPIDYLVLPRLIALTLMVPLLTVYADIMGIFGGALVGVAVFDITPARYMMQTREAVALSHFWVGLAKSLAYGALVALAGCMRGMQCGRSAADVGRATTSAVVTAIVAIILSCALLTVIFHVLGY